MPRCHLVRFGTLGEIGRFTALDAACYPRRARVILGTPRGLEVGEVLTVPDLESPDREPPHREQLAADGSIVRGMTIEDELLDARLQKMRAEAHEACQARLAERGLEAVLMDVEHLFDGQ